MPTAKDKYKAFIQDNYVPIFFRPGYLDAVCDAPWNIILYEEDQQIKAVYAYMIKKKYFLHYIIQPQMCPYTGPFFFEPKDAMKAYTHLLSNLPKHHLIIQDYFHALPKVDVVKETISEKHTNVILSTMDVEKLWQSLSSNHRRLLRRAGRDLVLEVEDSMDAFLSFLSKGFEKRGKKNPNNPEIFRKIDAFLKPQGNRKIVKCTDQMGVVVAMCYFIQDEKWTYNFASGIIEDYRHYGMNLIFWNEIKSVLDEGRSFDFEGSMIPGIDKFFQRFKGQKIHYQSRHKSTNRAVDLLVKIKTLLAQ